MTLSQGSQATRTVGRMPRRATKKVTALAGDIARVRRSSAQSRPASEITQGSK